MRPAIQAIRATFEDIRRQETDRDVHRLSDAEAEDLEHLTQLILQKLLAVPIVRLKDFGAGASSFSHAIRLLCRLFSRSRCEDPSA